MKRNRPTRNDDITSNNGTSDSSANHILAPSAMQLTRQDVITRAGKMI